MKMKNNKGFLLGEETVKIVIALICIGFLVYFLAALYFSNSSNQKQKEAASVISRISEIINNPQTSLENLNALEPAGWYIFSFVGDEIKPNSCTGKNCLCICDNVFINFKNNQIKKCDNSGACLVILNLKKFETIKIEKGGLVSIEITKGNEISLRRILNNGS